MPLRLDVGVSQKKGQPDFGSLGASVHLQIELEGSLVNDSSRLRDSIRKLFGQAREAVEEELNGSPSSHDGSNSPQNGNGNRQRNGRAATASQVRAIHAIASRERLDLTAELQNRFGIDRPEDLLIGEASELIDAIKPVGNGAGGRR